MYSSIEELASLAQQYAEANDITVDFVNRLGWGTDGAVWPTNADTAVKAFDREKTYVAERSCYQRLDQHSIDRLCDCAVPTLKGFDDNLMVIEIGIVSAPYILDFGKTYLDSQPEHSPETMEDWENDQRERWEDRWPDVQLILWQLERIGIYYTDPNCDNIRLP
jgi:hypothetical protein